ncbi:MAG: amidohydrolase [Chitinophagaceae bacterium]|nr:MAG: amidohydrolase [Chitinophagaceae bacterium]
MIDSHVHFWNFDPVRDSWITTEMNAIRKDFDPNGFIEASSSTPITGCIAVQADQSEEQNHFLLSLGQENSVIKGIVGWVDFLNPNLEERLTYWKQFELIKGWRHVLQAENEAFILNQTFVNGLKKLKQYHYTYDLLCYHDQLKAIIKLVNQIPDQSFILDHCGKPNIKSKNIKQWQEDLTILAENPNVSCKLSGLLTEADWHNFTESQIYECFDTVFDKFGCNRIMYGSDWPVVLVSRQYSDWFGFVSRYASRFSEHEREQLFFGNAARFYNLNPSITTASKP